MRARVAGLSLLVLAGCGPTWKDISRGVYEPPPATTHSDVRDRRRTYYDRAATQPHTETSWMIRADGHALKDGPERRWFRNGQLEYERHWIADDPAGRWRTWFEDGTQRFEHVYDRTGETQMTWWHASGAISSAGPARNGVREGAWTGAHPGGTPAFEGRFSAGKRDGFWIFWYPDGSIEESGWYVRGERTGTWESYAPGERRGSTAEESADAAPADDQ